MRTSLKEEFADLDRRLVATAKHDPTCQVLMTMPGVGPVVALTVKTAIDAPERLDLSRFSAAPGARLGHFPFEGDGAFPA